MVSQNTNRQIQNLQKAQPYERWSSRLGIILAVAGGAIGIGNFLRFPGQVAQFGGGAFMLAYLLGFILLGLPMCWAEWTAGRYAGSQGHHTIPGIMAFVLGKEYGKYIGAFCLLIPTVVYCYFTSVQAWCLAYAINLLTGNLKAETPEQAQSFFQQLTGLHANGSAWKMGMGYLLPFLILSLVINYSIIAQGISRGIERCCKWAVPTLFILGFIILTRVLTLGTPDISRPEASINQGLGYMWNPEKVFLEEAYEEAGITHWKKVEELVSEATILRAEETLGPSLKGASPQFRIRRISIWEQLMNTRLWLAAAGQIFFSLAVGFGVIGTYASYLKPKDDVALGALSSASANEAAEVGLGGLITIPAAVAFLGVAGLADQTSLFSLGFNVLPLVFAKMEGGAIFGFLFFFLLFLSAVTATLSMLQPGIAFLEAIFNIKRSKAVFISSLVSLTGIALVTYFTEDLKAMDSLDFWCGNFLIYTLSMLFISLFAWRLGINKIWKELHKGAAIRIPFFFKWVIPYITPCFLIFIFTLWLSENFFHLGSTETRLDPHILDLFSETPNPAACWAIGWALTILVFLLYCTKRLIIYDKALKK